MAPAHLLADFAVRLAFGLVVAVIVTSWRAVPPAFFRAQSQIVMAILVLAALSQGSSRGDSHLLWLAVIAAAASYLMTVSWGLGLPPIAIGLELLVLLLAGSWIIHASQTAEPAAWAYKAVSRAVSGLLLGATLHSMLLGHHYLVAPSMTIRPLTRSLDVIAIGLAARCLLDGIGLWVGPGQVLGITSGGHAGDTTFVVMRWGMGVVGAAVSVYLARRTAAIRSTQSATGILYITTIFVLFGELASLVMSGRGPVG
jgi:hypothetical protein